MLNLKERYRKNVYGIMGTLIFHILLVAGFLLAELRLNVKPEKEEILFMNFTVSEEKEKIPDTERTMDKNAAEGKSSGNEQNTGSNRAVNDALVKDKFFDAKYKRDIEEANNMVAEVNKQLSKKVPSIKKFEMPEVTTEGQDTASIKNTVYSGKSNIHYSLENRFHVRLPIPVYLAKGGGVITVDIQVDRSGEVIKASVRPANNINDPMLPEYALQAAERTVFNSDSKAPAVQKGTITYQFVAQ